MQLRNRQDFWSGMMFIVLGLGFSWQASSYQMGTAARMGPGYFPFWLGLVLALLGAIVLIGSLSKKATETHVDRFDWRIVFLVIGSVVVYAWCSSSWASISRSSCWSCSAAWRAMSSASRSRWPTAFSWWCSRTWPSSRAWD